MHIYSTKLLMRSWRWSDVGDNEPVCVLHPQSVELLFICCVARVEACSFTQQQQCCVKVTCVYNVASAGRALSKPGSVLHPCSQKRKRKPTDTKQALRALDLCSGEPRTCAMIYSRAAAALGYSTTFTPTALTALICSDYIRVSVLPYQLLLITVLWVLQIGFIMHPRNWLTVFSRFGFSLVRFS